MNQQRVCFVIPPSVFLLDERVFMSLGALKVASAIEAHFSIDVLDLAGVANFQDAVLDYAATNSADIFCITITTPQLPSTVEIISILRAHAPGKRIILGGPHITLVNAAYRREQKMCQLGRASKALQDLLKLGDVIVAGDGEKAIFTALKQDSPSLLDADDARSPLFLDGDDLNTLPWPARHLVDIDSYHYQIDGERALSIVSQLGCPYGCGFCGGRNSPSLRRMRSRSVESVLAEMEHLYRTYGVKGFMFYDDELNVNRNLITGLLAKIIELQKRLGVEFRLRGFVKSQLFTGEQAELMYKAGFRWILSGFESGSPEMLANMNKHASVEDNTHCVQLAQKYGLKVKALMSIGHPGESPQSVRDTCDWLLTVRPDDFDITVITVYPGTPYYDDAVAHPDLPGVWAYSKNGSKLYSLEIDYNSTAGFYKGDPNGGYKSFVYTDFLEPEEIVRLRGSVEDLVRRELGIPYPASAISTRHEHSMGQSGKLPTHILRQSKNDHL